MWLMFESLLKGGYGVANMYRSLTSDTGFNKPMQDCVLAYVDERDLSTSQKIRDGFKEAVSSTRTDIRKMQTDEYRIDATFQIFAAYNYLSHGVHDEQDRRCIFNYIERVPEDKKVGDQEFKDKVRSEAAAFLAHVEAYEYLDSRRPLYLPVFLTAGKAEGWRALETKEEPSNTHAGSLHAAYLLAQWIDNNRPTAPLTATELQSSSGSSLGRKVIKDLLDSLASCHGDTSSNYSLDWFLRRGIRVETQTDKNTSRFSFKYVTPNPRTED